MHLIQKFVDFKGDSNPKKFPKTKKNPKNSASLYSILMYQIKFPPPHHGY